MTTEDNPLTAKLVIHDEAGEHEVKPLDDRAIATLRAICSGRRRTPDKAVMIAALFRIAHASDNAAARDLVHGAKRWSRSDYTHAEWIIRRALPFV